MGKEERTTKTALRASCYCGDGKNVAVVQCVAEAPKRAWTRQTELEPLSGHWPSCQELRVS